MKKLLILIFVLTGLHSYSQFGFYKVKNISLDDLKNRTLLVPLGHLDTAMVRKFQYVFEKFWRISKFKIVRPPEVDKYKDNMKYYYFNFESLIVMSDHGNYEQYYLKLKCKKDIGKRKPKELILASWDLYMKDNVFCNLTPGILKLYICAFQDFMENENLKKTNFKIIDKPGITDLEKNVLYVPDYILFKRDMFGRFHALTEEAVFKGFNGKYKVVTNEELDHLILEADQPAYIYIYVANHFCFASIYEAQANKIIYCIQDANRVPQADDFKRIFRYLK